MVVQPRQPLPAESSRDRPNILQTSDTFCRQPNLLQRMTAVYKAAPWYLNA